MLPVLRHAFLQFQQGFIISSYLMNSKKKHMYALQRHACLSSINTSLAGCASKKPKITLVSSLKVGSSAFIDVYQCISQLCYCYVKYLLALTNDSISQSFERFKILRWFFIECSSDVFICQSDGREQTILKIASSDGFLARTSILTGSNDSFESTLVVNCDGDRLYRNVGWSIIEILKQSVVKMSLV